MVYHTVYQYLLPAANKISWLFFYILCKMIVAEKWFALNTVQNADCPMMRSVFG